MSLQEARKQILECVPNFSEGRDASKLDRIVAAMASVSGVAILDRTMDRDHNRSVVTFAGPPQAVAEGAFRAVEAALHVIDLNRHAGVHPRIGATDVVPFVPVAGVSLQDAVGIAERLGGQIWERLHIPVYLYEAAARRPERVQLENIRRGQFETLRKQALSELERRPDIGGPEWHPTAGATVVGARRFLIAYNINLATPEVEIARRIAKAIRSSSGGLPYVKALGLPLASRNLTQVSMNLTDFERTPLHVVFEAVREEARRQGIQIVGSELVGLIPRKALELSAGYDLQWEHFRSDMILEERLEKALR